MPPEHHHGAAQEPAAPSGRRGLRAAGLLLACLGLVGTVVFGSLLFSTVYGAQASVSTEETREVVQRLAAASARLTQRADESTGRDAGQDDILEQGEAAPLLVSQNPATERQTATVTAPAPALPTPTPSLPTPTRPPLRVLVPTPDLSTVSQEAVEPSQPAAEPAPSPPSAADALTAGPTDEPAGDGPPTPAAEPPPPSSVRALGVPRLRIQTGVVQVGWEPPAYVAGQISTTAALGAGNSVIVGHRRGHAGDVFARLVGARLGDEVVAVSDGDERRYVVSAIRTLPGSDITPMAPSDTPRVTLMTCVGDWNPLTGDFSHRLWVVAEPADLARATLAETVVRATEQAAAAPSPADALRARTDALLARAALSIMDAEARRKR